MSELDYLQNARMRLKLEKANTMPDLQFNFNDNRQSGNPVQMPNTLGNDKDEGEGEDTEETSDLHPNKPYKRRRLKLDPVHRLGRQLYKLKKKNPGLKRKRQLYQKQYRRKNKNALKRRSEFVRKAKKRLPKPQPRPNSHHSSFPNKDYQGMQSGPPNINTAPEELHTITDFTSTAPYYAYSYARTNRLVRALVAEVSKLLDTPSLP